MFINFTKLSTIDTEKKIVSYKICIVFKIKKKILSRFFQ